MKIIRTAPPPKAASRPIKEFHQPAPAAPPTAYPKPSNAVAAKAVRVARAAHKAS
jgi:hypothetical protein